MATKSETSLTKSNHTVKAFVTFRVAGATLSPDSITKLLRIHPTHTHKAGETYSTGRSKITPKSGIWLFSTDKILLSKDLYEHIDLVLILLGWGRSPRDRDNVALFRLARFLRKEPSLSATLSLFWYGTRDATEPKIPDSLIEFLRLMRISVETDFDRDESSPHKAA